MTTGSFRAREEGLGLWNASEGEFANDPGSSINGQP